MSAVDAKNKSLRSDYKAEFAALKSDIARWGVAIILAVVATVGAGVAVLRYDRAPVMPPVIINNPPVAQAPSEPVGGG